jgi:thiol-disulfide isomerase/thioredoxin
MSQRGPAADKICTRQLPRYGPPWQKSPVAIGTPRWPLLSAEGSPAMLHCAKKLSRLLVGLATIAASHLAEGAKPTPKEALSLVPVQRDVDYDVPDAKEAEQCTVAVETIGGITGWVVRTDSGQVLRRFLDTNGDNKVDQWCYYKDGIEVYRDIDGNFNNKADQYRWLGTAGTRWGLDDDENGRIDSWKVISAEEVTAEVVAALRDRDASRFQRLLLSTSELQALGLSSKQAGELGEKLAAASKSFAAEAARQRVVTAKSEWVHFGASRPGVVPAGTDGSTKDLIVYDNVTAVVETDEKHGQLTIGTLVKVGETWKLFDLPKALGGDQTAAAPGYFFQASFPARPEVDAPAPASNVSPEMKKLVEDLEQLDKRLVAAKPNEQAKLNAARADLLDRIVAIAPAEDRGLWIKQYTETVSAAIQAGNFPDGIRRLQALLATVSSQGDDELAPYIKFRILTAEYNRDISQKDANYEKITTAYQTQLERFIQDHPKSPDAAEAMLQLAINAEFAGKTDDAINWFSRIASEFPQSDLKPKALGARRRLESVGKAIPFQGKTLDGRTFDLAAAKGKVVLIHYWATWADPCKPDLATIKSLVAKYGNQGFYPVGVNLDGEAKEATAYARQEKLTWPQLFEQGGLDSPLATNLGVLTLPTMILVGKDGRVLNRNITAGELDAELKKLLR